MLGKWDEWYKKLKQPGSFKYGNTVTYKVAADFLKGLSVEDWGCGGAQFKKLHDGPYTGLDGSKTPYADKIVDFREYRSNVEGIVMRHVLEHNYEWEKVLRNALDSFTKRFCLIIFTPFQPETHEIAHNKRHGVDVPDIGFKPSDIENILERYHWWTEDYETNTAYGIEHVYFIEK